jgi:hypothetical protein
MSYVFYFVVIFLLVLWIETPLLVPSNLLITRRDQGEELEQWLKTFNWNARVDSTLHSKLPTYKFYSGVLNILLELSRKLGGTYQESLIFLRESLQGDRQFEKKMKETIRGVYLQMLLMMFLTWSFIFSALMIVEIEISLMNLFLILIWQMIGGGVLPFILNYYRKKYFSEIGLLWKILFILKSLSKVPISRSEVFSHAGVQELKLIKQPSLLALVEKLKDSCHRTLKFGTSYEEDLRYLMEELRFVEKWHCELFEKRLMVIKLLLMSVFFLPSYLAFIFFLLEGLRPLL